MANILLGVTGSVAAIYTPELFRDLRQAGHVVKVVATRAALHFFDASLIADGTPEARRLASGLETRDRETLILDEDEWAGTGYQRGDAVLHIELRRWADALVVAPLDANTLAKLALGLADNCLTCVYRAWDRSRPVVLGPAMNTLMWEHPATARHLDQVRADLGTAYYLVSPQVKKLACEDVGIGALAPREEILAVLAGALQAS